ncbi:GumC family protein [Novosphingobium humi]|uniref:GumC family protein n=1 Tax=Novosphingobium humi TaxID=2282397 RepID=UPI0025AFA56E|nr:polysaccharide biosynthesis tyrosine autokinase [Novosphingobium humi]WJS99341.1 polysaccharide biosynthesis tyrosine autokinase [Novosphingobium humi]
MASMGGIRDEERLDLAAVTSRYRRHVGPLLACTAVGAILFGGLTYFLPNRYTAVTEMTYAPQVPPDVSQNSSAVPAPLSDQQRDSRIDAAVQGIQSLPVAVRVVTALKLERDPQLADKAKKYLTGGNVREAVAAALLDSLKVKRVSETPLIDISFTHADPLQAAKISDAFGKAYEDQQSADNTALSQSSSNRMDASMVQMAQQARDADAAVARFKLEHRVEFDPKSPAIGQDIAMLASSLGMAQAQLGEARARASFVRQGGMNDQFATNSPLTPLRDQQAQVSRNLASLQSRYGSMHPKVIEAQKELDSINNQVRSETVRQSDQAYASVRFEEQKVKALSSALAEARNRQINQIAAATQLEGLQRQAETANTLYNNMLSNSTQEVAKRAVLPPDTTITMRASPPMRPSFPILPLNIAIGLILGFAAGIGIAFFRERWSIGIDNNGDIERLLGKTYLNSLPTLASAIDRPNTKDPVEALTAHPLSLYAEAYRSLATNLRMSDQNVKVIAVTSALPKEGKTTTAINMARTQAMAGERVLLMDCDLRRRSVTTLLAPDAKIGLNQVINGTAALEEAISVDSTGLHLLQLAPQSHIGPQPFGTQAFDELMGKLREEYDLIVIDTAPVLAVVDVRLLLPHIDALALLTRWRQTPVRATRAAIHQLETVGGRVDGIALSLVDANAQAHVGYGDASQYYTEMKEYYATA